MNCVSSYDICVYYFWFVFFPWGIPPLHSDWSLSCDHGLDYATECENTINIIINNNIPFITERRVQRNQCLCRRVL